MVTEEFYKFGKATSFVKYRICDLTIPVSIKFLFYLQKVNFI